MTKHTEPQPSEDVELDPAESVEGAGPTATTEDGEDRIANASEAASVAGNASRAASAAGTMSRAASYSESDARDDLALQDGLEEDVDPDSMSYRVGDVWTLPKGETVVVPPDGGAVTARGSYTLTAPGTYKCGDVEIDVQPRTVK